MQTFRPSQAMLLHVLQTRMMHESCTAMDGNALFHTVAEEGNLTRRDLVTAADNAANMLTAAQLDNLMKCFLCLLHSVAAVIYKCMFYTVLIVTFGRGHACLYSSSLYLFIFVLKGHIFMYTQLRHESRPACLAKHVKLNPEMKSPHLFVLPVFRPLNN